jgi:hypothetical protein
VVGVVVNNHGGYMALIIEAPNEIYSIENNKNIKLFLAGGITNCPDWQSQMVTDLQDVHGLTIFNPRRKNFPINDPTAAEAQITWEYNHLRDADYISFWFSAGSLNPITLYELGRWGNSSKKVIFVGCDPDYARKQDVVIQTALSRPEIELVYSIEDLSETIRGLMEYANLYDEL